MTVVIGRAKINLTLDLLGKRDDGYHELMSVMQSIDLFDRLIIRPSSELSLGMSLRSGVSKWLPQDERNDVMRAAHLLHKQCGVSCGAEIFMEKFIPTQAGLGGGSADAAAALIGLNKHWKLGLSDEELRDFAAQLGSDIPFNLRGGTALCRGRGEIVQPLPPLPPVYVTLFKPPRGLSTSRIFSTLNISDFEEGTSLKFVDALLSEDACMFDFMSNQLQETACNELPELFEFTRRLRDEGVPWWQMSGSGSTIFVLAKDKEQALRYRKDLAPLYWWSFATKTSDKGAELR